MRLVTGSVIFLTLAIHPALGNEAFIAQQTNKVAVTEQAAVASTKTALAAAMLAFPVQSKALNSNPLAQAAGLPAQNPATALGNTSLVTQVGTNNVAVVSQTGSGNASAIVQHGSGNQAMVTQRH